MKNLKKDIIVNDFKDPMKLTLFLTYRFGNWTYYNFRVPIVRQLLMIFYRILDLIFVRVINNALIPARAKIGGGLRLPHSGMGIVIHPNASIGENVTIFHQVTIGYKDTPTSSFGPPVIGSNVYVGAGAKILGDILIDDGSIVGANAVVLNDVSRNTTVVGIPAKNPKSKKKKFV